MRQIVLLLFVCLSAGCFAQTQQGFSAKVYQAGTDSAMEGVSVLNRRSKATTTTDHSGFFRIIASENDTLVLSAVGFKPQLIVADFYNLLTQQSIELRKDYFTLPAVLVKSSYRQDSLNRRMEYQRIYEKDMRITGGNRPEKGFGIVVSPISHFSSKAKAERRLKQQLKKQEQDYYIDFMFPASLVSSLTRLTGDSLRLFMYRYRPSYNFCRSQDRQGITLYINDKFREFMRRND